MQNLSKMPSIEKDIKIFSQVKDKVYKKQWNRYV